MNRVDALRRVYSEMESLKEEEKRLSVPIVMNMGLIRNLFDVFTVSLKRLCPDANPRDTESRKKFLYAIIYIFSPATLVGGVMRHKLRECVSRTIGYSPTGVSRDYKTAIFYCATYKGFKEEVETIIRDMLKILGKEGDI